MANILWEMFVKMLTHIHLVVLAHLQGGGVCRGEMGLGPSLPPVEQARRDSAPLGKWNAYFLLRRMQVLVVGTLEQG